MKTPNTPKTQLSSKAKLFSIAILLVAIVGTSAPFIHMVFPKQHQEVLDIKAAHDRCEITDQEYLHCRLEQRETYTWFGYSNLYYFLAKIGKPFPVLCCTFMILYCIRYVGEERVQHTIRTTGPLLLFSAIYSFLYAFSRKLREELFIFHYIDFEHYGHPIYHHIILLVLSLFGTILCVQLLASKNSFTQKIKTLLHFIIRTRTQIITKENTSAIAIAQSSQEQFDQKFYTTLERITVSSKNSRLLSYKTLILRSCICCSILGSIALLAYPLHPNSGINEYISMRTAFWDGEINRGTYLQKKKEFRKKYPYKRAQLTNHHFIKEISHPIGLTFSFIILFLLLPFIHEKHAKRGILITSIAFSIIAVFFLRWAIFPFEGVKDDYHINYYYAMMSISTILIILVVYQFVQSAVTYKYKMMELIHFIVGTRKQVFTALTAQHETKEALQQEKEKFDEELYDTLDKVTKK